MKDKLRIIPGNRRSPSSIRAKISQAWLLTCPVLSPQCASVAEMPHPWVQVNRPTVSVQLGFLTQGQGTFYTGGSDGVAALNSLNRDADTAPAVAGATPATAPQTQRH